MLAAAAGRDSTHCLFSTTRQLSPEYCSLVLSSGITKESCEIKCAHGLRQLWRVGVVTEPIYHCYSHTIVFGSFSLYSVSVLLSECHEWSPAHNSACLRLMGHAAVFAVNAALVASQWQHHA